MLGLLMSLSLVFPLAMLVRGLVEEREKRLKETMCIMGLQARGPSPDTSSICPHLRCSEGACPQRGTMCVIV